MPENDASVLSLGDLEWGQSGIGFKGELESEPGYATSPLIVIFGYNRKENKS